MEANVRIIGASAMHPTNICRRVIGACEPRHSAVATGFGFRKHFATNRHAATVIIKGATTSGSTSKPHNITPAIHQPEGLHGQPANRLVRKPPSPSRNAVANDEIAPRIQRPADHGRMLLAAHRHQATVRPNIDNMIAKRITNRMGLYNLAANCEKFVPSPPVVSVMIMTCRCWDWSIIRSVFKSGWSRPRQAREKIRNDRNIDFTIGRRWSVEITSHSISYRTAKAFKVLQDSDQSRNQD